MKHGSLFSGIGGFELAAQWNGWENIFHCELDEFPRKILQYYWPKSKSYDDIKKTDFSEWNGKVDIITGGFPCQPFSHAGRRRGADDDRYLWPEMFRVIKEVRPRWVIAENVVGITNMVQQIGSTEMETQKNIFDEINQNQNKKNRRSWIEQSETIIQVEAEYIIESICRDLESIGYEVQPIIIPACAVGAPHRRDRIWIIANSNESTTGSPGTRGEIKGKRNNKYVQSCERRGTAKFDFGRIELKGVVADTGCIGFNINANEIKCWGNDASKKREYMLQKEQGRCNVWRVNSGGCNIGIDSNANKVRLQRRRNKRKLQKTKSNGKQRFINMGKFSNRRWEKFPTQSPVCCGNDGVSAGLDRRSVRKHRSESIKAYGNAIVPQVAFEIFKTIKQIENDE